MSRHTPRQKTTHATRAKDWRVEVANQVAKAPPWVLALIVLGLILLAMLLRVGPPEFRRVLCGEFFSQPMPDKPFPGQYVPPCKRGQTEIIGACWAKLAEPGPACGDFYEWKGDCYAPAPMGADQPTRRKPTSSVPLPPPANSRVVEADFR